MMPELDVAVMLLVLVSHLVGYSAAFYLFALLINIMDIHCYLSILNYTLILIVLICVLTVVILIVGSSASAFAVALANALTPVFRLAVA